MKKKLLVHQESSNNKDGIAYHVIKATNTTSPLIGDRLTQSEVNSLITRNYEVNITKRNV